MIETNEKLLQKACDEIKSGSFDSPYYAKAVARKYLSLIGQQILEDCKNVDNDPLTLDERLDIAREYLVDTDYTVVLREGEKKSGTQDIPEEGEWQ